MNPTRLWLVALVLCSAARSDDEPTPVLGSPIRLPATGIKLSLDAPATESADSDSVYIDPYNSEIYSDPFSNSAISDSVAGSSAFQPLDYMTVAPTFGLGEFKTPDYFSIPDFNAPQPLVKQSDPETELPEGYSYSKALENFFPTEVKKPAKK